MNMVKHGRFIWRDLYRLPIAYFILYYCIRRYYERRDDNAPPGEWYWAESLAWHWGYSMRGL